ncbi:MAG TPA: hypothetical protein VJ249_10005 [Candidatus Bathyarchaeia archaeon]|nr:hypothetical protein [Candidatus Bathyarchaeia archaeon]
MIKRVLLAIIALAATAGAAYTLNLLDQIVHGTLYYYGLQFSYDWANQYWLLLRVVQALLIITIITTVVGMAFSLRGFLNAVKQPIKIAPIPKTTRKAPAVTYNVEKPSHTYATPPPQSSPETVTPPQRQTQQQTSETPQWHGPSTTQTPVVPSSPHMSSDATEASRCPHCGKSFTQPLRMLDFQGDRPRVVNICPFCNETMPSGARVEGRNQNGDKKPSSRNGNSFPSKTVTQ